MTQKTRILVVEDQRGERDALNRLLRVEGYEVLSAKNVQEALTKIGECVDLVISDQRMGDSSGLDLLRTWKAKRPETPFIMVTAYGDVESAVAAMKLDALDYLTKPVNPDELLALVRGMTKTATVTSTSRPRGFEALVYGSAIMQSVVDRATRAAQTGSLVLILGESGTGKELIASGIHKHSRRQEGPYVAVNIAAIPEALVESELFGHVKGAFTGASADRQGRFAAAHGGTLFIDEIGDFEWSAQAKVLRVLENYTITPVGGNQDQQVDVRVIAATSRNLAELVAKGAFREDLFYRLNVVTIEIPPLRERREDIPLLIEAFLAALAATNKRRPLGLTNALEQFLLNHPWPGNVRQLRNALESMVVLAQSDTLDVGDLPLLLARLQDSPASAVPLIRDASLEEMEKVAVLDALQKHDGNRTHAATVLGISVRTLQRKLKGWGQSVDEEGT